MANMQAENKSNQSQFLKTDGGKTKSNSIEIPSISLPKGGGAIKGIDEKFSVNAVNGTASFSIPLPFSPARGASPSLTLSYNSGSGNGIFGLGWSLGLATIKRKTDKGLPQYLDFDDTDTYLFSEAEDLVPEFKKELDNSFSIDINGDFIKKERDSDDNLWKIRCYKPRIEGLFAKIERWTEKTTSIIKWRIISKENVTTLLGWSDKSVIADAQNPTKIYEWLPEFVFDDKGNCMQYKYLKEDEKGINKTLVHNKNRLDKLDKITYSNIYLEKILYGNSTPYKKFMDSIPAENDYFFETKFDYGEYDTNAPFAKIKDWDFRPDAFSDYKSGFEIRTTRLCKRVLLYHHFTGANEYDGLVKATNFIYDTSNQGFAFLKAVSLQGFIKKNDGTYTSKKLPETEFTYQPHDWNKTIKIIASADLVNAPTGLDEQQYQFTDLYNEGLSGILSEQANAWFYKRNLGGGKFENAKILSQKPSFAGLGAQLQLVDLAGDGGKQLVSYNTEPKGFFELNDNNDWQAFQYFENIPNINFAENNTRMLDLDGDGKPEIVISEDNVFSWHQSDGRRGFLQEKKSKKALDEEIGPHIVFADATQSIFLADMSGDGLTDIVRIRNGEVCYWANLGYGKFGMKTAMDNAPKFDNSDTFNPSFIRLADIDGSGTTDIIYLGKNRFTCYLNLNGNTFASQPFEIEAFPEINQNAKITVTDLLGNGVPCLVWSNNLDKNAQSPLKYIDLMNSKKPHIMVSYKNNMGKEVSIEYSPSTKFYIEDKLTGKPWATKLHFPVQCVSKTETVDKITGWRFVANYKYHHGYFDHAEKEFRGFGMVEQTDTEHFENWEKGNASNIVDATLHQAPVLSKSWFHTGAYLNREKILSQFANDYWYEEMKRQGIAVVNNEAELSDATIIAAEGIAASYIQNLSEIEQQQALRACKNMALRSEIFALDAPILNPTNAEIKKQITPFNVATHNCLIELLQPKGKNKYAIFVVKESESITYNYERNTEDPRVAHNLNLKLDKYGNVLESAAVVYPRVLADNTLPEETKTEQAKMSIIFKENKFTNDILTDEINRIPLPAESKTYELKGVAKTKPLYSTRDFENILVTSNEEIYQNFDTNPAPATSQKRLIEHIRTNYYNNNLNAKLALGALESLAMPFESYQLAYTPALLTDIFGAKVNDAILTEGKFAHSENDLNWWVRSGTTQYLDNLETVLDAQNRFFIPKSYTDPFGTKTKVKYAKNLFVEETEDELLNKTKVNLFNYRTLSPQILKDINSNISEVKTDELGMVKAMAIFGKGNEADDLTGILQETEALEQASITSFFASNISTDLTNQAKNLLNHATVRFLYDFDVYKITGRPAVVASISREEHFQQNNNSPLQIAFEYSNGMGTVAMKKVQAEPGLAKKVVVNPDGISYTISDENTAALLPKQLRWIANGRTIVNNKGKTVKQFEPYFSVTHHFENQKELVETGVSPIMHYDAVGRLIKTVLPNETFSKVEFDAWSQKVWDTNDTILESDWYKNRTNRLIDAKLIAEGKDPAKEKIAADKSAKHANTPNTLHFDTMGRSILSVDHNKNIATNADEFYKTKVKLDIEGNLRKVTDARELPENANKGNTLIEYKYDMLGNLVYQKSMDAGQRWLLSNILGNPLRTWDERNHEFQYAYDILHRPSQSKVIGGDGIRPLNHIYERVFYGESTPNPELKNCRGQVIKHYDTGGLVETPEYDFKGKAKFNTRKLFKNYKETANWIDANLVADLEIEAFTITTETDALGRITKQTTPDGSKISPKYNEAGLLNSESITQNAVEITYIKDIDYNEKGQRNKIIYGNDVSTKYIYDKETFRINRMESRRLNNDLLQNLCYTFDAMGNVTAIDDKAIPINFFANSLIEPVSEFTYDALYRIVEAIGRENNAALNFGDCDNWNDKNFLLPINLGDPMAVRNYTQKYKYDEVGNISEMKHVALGGNWTRIYNYETNNNRLKSTNIGDNGNPANYTKYAHHAQHGFLTELPHLEKIEWNFKEEIALTSRQHCTADNIPIITYYQYDGSGQRLRKITENFAPAGGNPTKKEERLYLSGYELYKKHSGADAGLQRESLSLIDEGNRFVTIETRNDVNDGTEKQLVRYQLHNHIGSAALELNGTSAASLISYEEYHPFGTTAYQAINSAIKSASKRYRFTGMERDEETGLEYHSARYYLPWLGRWLSADPISINDGVNLYRYCSNNPIAKSDKNGKQATGTDPLARPPVTFTPLLTQITPVDISGSLQFHNLLSADRSVSGQIGLTTGIRSSFGLTVPALSLNTSGFVDASGSARVDTSAGSAQLSLRGGAVIGDTSGLHLTTVGSASLQVPVPSEIPISGAVPTLAAGIPSATGSSQLQGAFAAGSFQLAEFRAQASVDSGRFRSSLDAHTLLNVGQLHLDATGTIGANGTPRIETVNATAEVNVGLVSFSARGSGTGNAEGGLSYSATGNLRILGLQSLQINGTGSASSTGADFRGTFSGPGPLYTSYIFGDFSLSTSTGIAARGVVLGVTYMPGVSVTDPAPPSPGFTALAGAPRSPWTPSGLAVGATLVDYRQGNLSWFSIGVLPDLSSNFSNNLQLGATLQGHF